MNDLLIKALFLAPVLAGTSCAQKPKEASEQPTTKPNIIFIVADDLGFGDVSAYGSKTINTPNIDFLAENGVRFNNGYATSATSTPSRYAFFTGLYPWKNKDAKILPGDAPLLIGSDQFTMPRMLQKAGYATAGIGKWHLGMGAGHVDWNETIHPNANNVGFDYTCLIAATNDRVPTVYVQNGKVVGLDPKDPIQISYKKNFKGEPTALSNPEMLKMKWSHGHNNSIVNGIPRIGFMKGGEKARWTGTDMADYFINRVKDFITENEKKPFFLYYGLHEPHVPRTPNPRFVGSTTMGPRGDSVMEADWCVGELMSFLKEKGLLDNTMVIFTSDNGPVLDDGYQDGAVTKLGDHKPSGGLRGGKYSLFDAGTHVPFFVYWKGKIQPHVSEALISQLDLPASIAHLTGLKVPQGLDSRDYLDVFMGKSDQGRNDLVVEAQSRLAYRTNEYTLIPPYSGPKINGAGVEVGNLAKFALFDVKADPHQTKDLATNEPTKVEELKKAFMNITGSYYNPDAKAASLK
ncbi:MAG: sulfatase-like hydrolase/transferase [Massilibacteroides sp.]|nr:sulfatase-like hydrolase/transferase [Massilibacteroides sp.]